jgi:hypothetical protein
LGRDSTLEDVDRVVEVLRGVRERATK